MLGYWNLAIRETIDELSALGPEIYVLKEVPNHPFFPPVEIAKRVRLGESRTGLTSPVSRYERLHRDVNASFESLRNLPRVHFLDPTGLLCPNHVDCVSSVGDDVLYKDDDHVSVRGSLFLKPLLMNAFRKAERPKGEH